MYAPDACFPSNCVCIAEVTPLRYWNSVSLTDPSAIFAASREPVIELAPKSNANSVASITKPPLAFKSVLNVVPV